MRHLQVVQELQSREISGDRSLVSMCEAPIDLNARE